MYLLLFRQGQSAVVGDPVGDRRHVRGQPLPLEPLRVPRAARRRPRGQRAGAGRDPATACASSTCRFTLSRRARRPALATSTLHLRPGREPRARRRERLRQDHADQAADAALRADRRAHPARRPRPARVGRERAARAASASSSRTSRATSCSSARTSAPATCEHFDDEARWRDAARDWAWRRRSSTSCPNGYHTQLGRWFKDGRELSGGQWQKIALSRAFMRTRRRHPRARRADRGDGRRGRGRRSSSTSAR